MRTESTPKGVAACARALAAPARGPGTAPGRPWAPAATPRCSRAAAPPWRPSRRSCSWPRCSPHASPPSAYLACTSSFVPETCSASCCEECTTMQSITVVAHSAKEAEQAGQRLQGGAARIQQLSKCCRSTTAQCMQACKMQYTAPKQLINARGLTWEGLTRHAYQHSPMHCASWTGK
jgi:hypothetical protein